MSICSSPVGYFLIGISSAICCVVPTAMADSNWVDSVGTSGNWSTPSGDPGWDGVVPNGTGVIASYSGTKNATTVQDMGAGVTIGTLQSTGSGNASWTINVTNPITLQVPSGSALIENSRSAVGGYRLNVNSGSSLSLASDLIVRNTSGSISTSGSIQLNPNLIGSGNITFDNSSSNNTGIGQIFLNGGTTSSFTGNVLVRRGAVSFNDKDHFGNQATNQITLGESGQGSVSLVSSAPVGTVLNNVVAASGSVGTTLLGSVSAATSGNTTFSGTVTLNGDLTLTSANTGTGFVSLSNTVSGAGALTKTGAGIARLAGVNLYTGNTTISAGALNLMSGSEERFRIQDGNLSNQILGTGAIDFNGMLRLDITGLTASSGIWNLVDVNNLADTWGSGSFSVAFLGGPTFTNAGSGNYTSGSWTFAQSTGNLTLVPEPGCLSMLAAACATLAMRRRRA